MYNYTGGTTIDFEAVDSATKKIQWRHNGVRYGGPNDTAHKKLTDRLPDRLKNSLDSDPCVVKSGAETRAAVALLSRSIRIVSAGGKWGKISTGRHRLFVRRPHGHSAGLQGGSNSGRRIRADGPRRTARSLPRPLPQGTANTRQYLREGLVDQRIDDALDRAALDARRDRGAQCRLQVDRPRLLPRGRDRNRQQVLFQYRNLRPRRGRQQAEPAQRSRAYWPPIRRRRTSRSFPS